MTCGGCAASVKRILESQVSFLSKLLNTIPLPSKFYILTSRMLCIFTTGKTFDFGRDEFVNESGNVSSNTGSEMTNYCDEFIILTKGFNGIDKNLR